MQLTRILREGFIAGLIGAGAVALWFLIVDIIAGRPFFTPAMLGSAAARRTHLVERGDRQRDRGVRHGILPVASASEDRGNAEAASAGGDGRGGIENCGFRIADCGIDGRASSQVAPFFDTRAFESAIRNPKSAIP